jgi:hypothetical protein
VGGVLIDLGEVTRVDEPVARAGDDRRQPHPHRALLAALTVVLAGTLAGAVHQVPPPAPVLIGAKLGDKMFVDANGLFMAGAGPALNSQDVQNKIISWYGVPGGELHSRTTVAVPGPIFQVTAAGQTVLVSYLIDGDREEATAALISGSDKALWRRPARLLSASGPAGLAILRENSPDLGGVVWSGVDLTTGASRWTIRQPRHGIATLAGYDPAGFPRWLVTSTADGQIEVLDTISGAVLSRITAPLGVRAADADVPIWTAADLLLVGGDGTTAFALPRLERRWRIDSSFAGRWVQPDCAGVICSLSWSGGMRVLDPATGALRWADDRWNNADEAGPYLLVSDTTPQVQRPVTVVDAGTGEDHGAFGPWQPDGAAAADGTVIGLQEQLADGIVWFARLDPATTRVRVLGAATEVAGDCGVTAVALICRRLDAGVGIWRLG